MAVLRRTLFAPVRRPVAAAAIGAQANVIVSCHPLTGWAAIQAARCDPGGHVPVVSVVTDLAAIHTSWRHPRPDLVTVPSAQALQLFTSGRDGCIYTGLPVDARARSGPLPPEEKAAVRRSLGLRETGCVVLLSGGGEGCGGLARRSAAILRRFPDIQVVAACGRNDRLRRRLTALASRAGDRLTVIGFTANFTDWLHCADLVVTKAGPGMIAEAACCGTPLLLASHLPGQERRNTELVEQAGAGRRVRSVRRLLRELARLRSDPVGLAAMQAGCRRLARPGAADHVARLIGELAGLAPPRTHEVATAAPPEAVGQLTGATASGQVAR
jgi:1,2-diacylglycerol 3-beta-galactosyltransferase